LRLNLRIHKPIGNGDPIADDGNVLMRGVGNLYGYRPLRTLGAWRRS
jgi:hypothetical protein